MTDSAAETGDEDHSAFADVVAFGTRRLRLGTVTGFDADRGRGVVLGETGAIFEFHSTAIADGSRQIDLASSVSFGVRAVVGGRFEAVGLSMVEAATPHANGAGDSSSEDPKRG